MASVSEQAATPGIERRTRGSSAIWRRSRQIAEELGFSGGPFPAEALRLPPANGFNPFGIFIDDAISCKKQPAIGCPTHTPFFSTKDG